MPQRGNPQLPIRLSPERRKLWEEAARIDRRTITDFVRQATDQHAKEIIRRNEMRHAKAPAEKFNPGDKVWSIRVGNKRVAAIIIERASYGGGYYAAYDPRNPDCESFWTCDHYLEART